VLRDRLCQTASVGGDPRLWAALDSRINGTNPNAAVTPAQWASYVNALVDTQLDWAHAAVQGLLSEQVIVHGPHPFSGDFTVFCDAIASAIG
jgi:hypothetical protein